MSKPIIAVFGATGKTGGGMVEAILADGSFQARAITRNPDSAAAKGMSTFIIRASGSVIDSHQHLPRRVSRS